MIAWSGVVDVISSQHWNPDQGSGTHERIITRAAHWRAVIPEFNPNRIRTE